MTLEDFFAPKKRRKEGTTTQEFQFLNVTESSELDDLSKMVVRVQCQRDFHRKKQEKVSSLGGLDNVIRTRTTTARRLGRVQRFRLEASGLQPTRNQPRSQFAVRSSGGQLITKAKTSSSTCHKEPKGNEAKQNSTLTYPTCILAHDPGCTCFLLCKMKDLGLGDLDPFGSLPVVQSTRVKLLMDNRTYKFPSQQTIFAKSLLIHSLQLCLLVTQEAKSINLW
jgi:hypothetical protein